tara:strand:+ start:1699 stop:2442 length:744 start_codon:yes stop_codon:yes gene_type:complete
MIEDIKNKIIKYKYQIGGVILISLLTGIYKLNQTKDKINIQSEIISDQNQEILINELKKEKEKNKNLIQERKKTIQKKTKEESKNKLNLPMYENTGYKNDIQQKQMLTLKITHNDLINNSFDKQLHESFSIDKISDIYLDSFLTFKIGSSNKNDQTNKQYFILTIDQFNLKSISNDPNLNNNYIIPNNDSNGTNIKLHHSEKLNYISTILPNKLKNITGSITDTNLNSIIHTDGYFIANFIIINRID